MTEESPMPAAEPMTQEIVERLKGLLPRILPITIRDGPDYADLLFGEHATQAMTMDPATWLEIGRLLETLLSTLTNLTPSGVERIRAEAFEQAAEVCEQQARDFLSPEYATPQPIGSMTERFACNECAAAIRALALPSEPPSQGDVELASAMELLVIAQRQTNADHDRIRRLEGAVQLMASAVRPLAKQGEDYIWRPVERLLRIADAAILDQPLPALAKEDGRP